jgi:Carboxypeptidase regulatory-like domain
VKKLQNVPPELPWVSDYQQFASEIFSRLTKGASMRSLRVLALIAVLSCASILTWAQTATTSLHGTVADAKGGVLQDATVTIMNPETGYSHSTKTDSQGVYQFLQVVPGTYTVAADAPGFATIKQERVQLLVSVPATLNLTMQVQGTAVTIEVSGEGERVNTTDASIGNAFGNRQILELPFEGRNPVEILSLQPGVTYTGNLDANNTDRNVDSRAGAVNGSRGDQANITLDGVDNNDQNNGFAFKGALRATLDSVEEFRVTTANSNADSGRSSGAQINMVTKSGTNRWHGSAYEYNRSNVGQANDWFNKSAQISTGLPNKPGHLTRNTFGASLGGPIKKDRLFFFANWEAQRTSETQQVTRVVPSDDLRNGIVRYICDSTDPNCTTSNPNVPVVSTPAGLLVTMSPATLAMIDPNCTASGTCPLGPGANPAIQQIFTLYPHANCPSCGNGNNSADGLNFQGFTFAGANPQRLNTYIVKLDYNISSNGNHRLFVRGNLQDDHVSFPPQFPGLTPNLSDAVPNKGIAAGYVATLSSTVINNFRYGFVREALSEIGAGTKDYIDLRGLDTTRGDENHSFVVAVPVHNFVDDLSWTKGTHTIQVGANFRMIGDIRNSTLSSFSRGQTNASWLDTASIANTGNSLDPAAFGLPAVDSSFQTSYDYPVAALTGLIVEVDKRYNSDIHGNTFPDGTPNQRHFVSHEFETYIQDAWRIKPNLTFTYGLRWTLLQPPYEKNGVQVAPTISLDNWFKQRALTQALGQPFNQLIDFGLSGQANGKAPYWGYDYKDFAPRLAIAWSPNLGGVGKTSIRAGAGMYYDHFGEGTVNTFDRRGSFGLSTLLTNPGGQQTVDSAPRMTVNGLYTLPPQITTPCGSSCGPLPLEFPATNFATQWGLDDKLRTPYSYVFNVSFERELPHNFVISLSYVGRLSRRLLQEEDLAQPRDIRDPQSNTDYYQAVRLLDNAVLAGTPESDVAPIPYWENIFGATSSAANGGISNQCASGIPASPTATQNLYDLMACGLVHNETTFQQIIDGVAGLPCNPGCPTLDGHTGPTQYLAPQFSSLYAWRSIGNASYNAGQFLLSRHMKGLQFDFNYTWSKSIDMGSDTEQIGNGIFLGGPPAGDQIFNAWNPKLNRAISTFDTTHQINANWVAELPFGRGRRFAGSTGRLVEALIGGWDWTGLYRWTSGFPVSISNGSAWATNWELAGYATQIGPQPKTGVNVVNGVPNIFTAPDIALQSYRQDFPGEVGVRNSIRGPGYFGVDMGLNKTFRITENHQVRFSWETFNVFNSVRFDSLTASTAIDTSTTFGNFTKTLTVPRVMQFALRYSF